MNARAQLQLGAAGFIGGAHLGVAQKDAAGREIGRGDKAHQLVRGDVGIIDLRHNAVDDLGGVVRRDVGGQSHGDAAGAVHQQVGEAAGQHVRLLLRVVEVQAEVDGVFFNIAQHIQRERLHTRLGVSHGGRAVAVH